VSAYVHAISAAIVRERLTHVCQMRVSGSPKNGVSPGLASGVCFEILSCLKKVGLMRGRAFSTTLVAGVRTTLRASRARLSAAAAERRLLRTAATGSGEVGVRDRSLFSSKKL
jgi:hypothetical protein